MQPVPVLSPVDESHAEAAAPGVARTRGLTPSSSRRRFHTAPQSLPGFIAAVMEPTLHIGALHLSHTVNGVTFTRASVALLLLVMVLTFPGRDRFHDRPAAAAGGILASWLVVAGQMLVCGWATGTLELYDDAVLMTWAVLSPLVQWIAVCIGGAVLHRQQRLPAAAEQAVIVGAGPLALGVAQALRSRRVAPTRVLGYFDDRSGARIEPEAARARLGPLAGVAEYVKSEGVTQVYITLPLGSQPRIVSLLESLQGTTASLYLVPDLFGASVIQGRLQDIDGLPVVGLCETPFTGVNAAAKRAVDVALSLLVLVITAPAMAAIALGVKCSSPGPALFRQRRNGLGGEEIVVYKFRTMRAADDGAVVPQARRGDPRVTRLGAFLRRTSLDELPQFINVLQGRMSIVGPRPHAVSHNLQYAEAIRGYMVRHKVRPGITGWAQINGHRGETGTLDKMRARVECDLDYLRNWSLGLDLHIMARTVRLIVGDRNAY